MIERHLVSSAYGFMVITYLQSYKRANAQVIMHAIRKYAADSCILVLSKYYSHI